MKRIATLVGCAIGDALGNPFEMKRANYEPLQNWDGRFKAGGTFWKGEAGQYTDDTLMSIALASSLVEHGDFNPEDIAQKYLDWFNSNNFRGGGNTTKFALTNLKNGVSYTDSGLTTMNGKPACGNGTAMRAHPIGLAFCENKEKAMWFAMADASITHNTTEAKMGSAAVALSTALIASETVDYPSQLITVLPNMLETSDVKTKLELAKKFIYEDVKPAEALDAIGVSGYVADTVAAALYCFAKANSFEETVTMAVRGGGDTDTIAAIAGALAGTYYGLDEIPSYYKDEVESFELLQGLTDCLVNLQ